MRHGSGAFVATFFEPPWHARERASRDQVRYPELQFSDPDELSRIDRANVRDGLPLTSFGRAAVDTFARVGVPLEERREIEALTRNEMLSSARTPLIPEAPPLRPLPPIQPPAPPPLPPPVSQQQLRPAPVPPRQDAAPRAGASASGGSPGRGPGQEGGRSGPVALSELPQWVQDGLARQAAVSAEGFGPGGPHGLPLRTSEEVAREERLPRETAGSRRVARSELPQWVQDGLAQQAAVSAEGLGPGGPYGLPLRTSEEVAREELREFGRTRSRLALDLNDPDAPDGTFVPALRPFETDLTKFLADRGSTTPQPLVEAVQFLDRPGDPGLARIINSYPEVDRSEVSNLALDFEEWRDAERGLIEPPGLQAPRGSDIIDAIARAPLDGRLDEIPTPPKATVDDPFAEVPFEYVWAMLRVLNLRPGESPSQRDQVLIDSLDDDMQTRSLLAAQALKLAAETEGPIKGRLANETLSRALLGGEGAGTTSVRELLGEGLAGGGAAALLPFAHTTSSSIRSWVVRCGRLSTTRIASAET